MVVIVIVSVKEGTEQHGDGMGGERRRGVVEYVVKQE